MVIVAIPLLVLAFLGIHRHYRKIARRLRPAPPPFARQASRGTRSSSFQTRSTSRPRPRSGTPADRATATLAPCTCRAEAPTSAIRPRWYTLAGREPRLELLDSAEGRIDAILEELWKLPRGERDVVTVVIPEQFRRRSLLTAVRRRRRSGSSSASSPSRGSSSPTSPWSATTTAPTDTRRRTLVTRILVADVNAASMRALTYAQSLAADDVRAVFFATEPEEARKLEAAWLAARRRRAARGARGALPRHRRSAPQLCPRADEPTRTSP